MNDFAHIIGEGYAEDRDSGWGTGELFRDRSEPLVSVMKLSLCIYGYYQSDRKLRLGPDLAAPTPTLLYCLG